MTKPLFSPEVRKSLIEDILGACADPSNTTRMSAVSLSFRFNGRCGIEHVIFSFVISAARCAQSFTEYFRTARSYSNSFPVQTSLVVNILSLEIAPLVLECKIGLLSIHRKAIEYLPIQNTMLCWTKRLVQSFIKLLTLWAPTVSRSQKFLNL